MQYQMAFDVLSTIMYCSLGVKKYRDVVVHFRAICCILSADAHFKSNSADCYLPVLPSKHTASDVSNHLTVVRLGEICA